MPFEKRRKMKGGQDISPTIWKQAEPNPEPEPAPSPRVVFYFWGARTYVWKRVFAILHLCPDPKLAFLRFYTYVRTANKIENAFLRFYTYVRTQHSHFCDSTPMSGPKTRDFTILHFCTHMDAASAHLDATLTHINFHELAKHRVCSRCKRKTCLILNLGVSPRRAELHIS